MARRRAGEPFIRSGGRMPCGGEQPVLDAVKDAHQQTRGLHRFGCPGQVAVADPPVLDRGLDDDPATRLVLAHGGQRET